MRDVRPIFDAFMSPGSVTERLHFFVGRYEPGDRISAGGGNEIEGEDIAVLEIGIDEALAMIGSGAIRDGKTIMLLQYAALHLFPQPTPTRQPSHADPDRPAPTAPEPETIPRRWPTISVAWSKHPGRCSRPDTFR